MPLFDPVSAYYWLVKRVFAGRLWGAYRQLLIVPTRWCYRHRKTIGMSLLFIIFMKLMSCRMSWRTCYVPDVLGVGRLACDYPHLHFLLGLPPRWPCSHVLYLQGILPR